MKNTEPLKVGILYVVATPIGNLEDMTFRAVRILKEVDLIAAEDTRHTKKLLSHFGIQTRLISYYREKERERAAEIVGRLKAGASVALVSDAGTPGISDPGAILVNLAREAGICVVPLPGPSALTTALSAAGIECGTFVFLGFPPAKSGGRQKFLHEISSSSHPVVLYESPRRIKDLLADAVEIFGDRTAFWGRELTKAHEETLKSSLKELLAAASQQTNRGESVLVIFPGETEHIPSESVEDLLCWYRDHSGLTVKDVARRLAADLGISRSDAYRKALEIWHRDDGSSPTQPPDERDE